MIYINAVYIILAVLLFGFLIFIHESGHFLCARLFKVKIREFAIGMGPRIISKKSKKTGIAYSLRLFPVGGFVNMVGEDEESDDENAFNKKPVWQRMIITVAGAAMNLVIGIIVMGIIVFCSQNLLSTTVNQVPTGSYAEQSGLQSGDKIIKIGGTRVHIFNELVYEIMHEALDKNNLKTESDGTVVMITDLTVIRDGNTIDIPDAVFPTATEAGVIYGTLDFNIFLEEKTPLNLLKHSFFRATATIKMIWQSLGDLILGRYGMEAVSGPVGVTQALGQAASEGATSFIYLAVVISMNLGIMNLLPLPALDGGRLVFQVVELIRRKPIRPEIEGFVHFAGIVALMIFMVLITFKDIVSLFK